MNLLKNNKLLATLLIVLLGAALMAGCGSTTPAPEATPDQQKEQNTTSGAGNGKQEVNIYSARHYDVDAKLYEEFTNETGIKVNVIDGKAEELIERIKREGESTPADLFITVDGGVLNNAKTSGILQPIKSDTINAQVPAQYRDVDNEWIGLATRARVIVYSKERVQPEQLSTYEDLASDKWKGKILVRSSTSMYNQSLLASFIALSGEQQTEEWAQGLVNNFAQDPKGGDRDQAKAIAAGVGDVAIMNTYYVGLMVNSEDPEEVKAAQQIGLFFPNQETTGTHLNISGAGLIKHSQNKDNAVKLIEFLTATKAQELFSSDNFEFPVNPEAKLPELMNSWGTFKSQELDFAKIGEYNKKSVEIMNKVGWK
jgi:iron(III) transport system substrate-binding protein